MNISIWHTVSELVAHDHPNAARVHLGRERMVEIRLLKDSSRENLG